MESNCKPKVRSRLGLISSDAQLDENSSEENQINCLSGLKVQKRGEAIQHSDHFFNECNLERKGGFGLLYHELLEKINANTNCKCPANLCCFLGKSFIKTKTCKDDASDRFEHNAFQQEIRKIFDLEFNKIYQGSINVPFQNKNTQTHQQQGNNYLFFITDKFK
jgi:hypothetical protein